MSPTRVVVRGLQVTLVAPQPQLPDTPAAPSQDMLPPAVEVAAAPSAEAVRDHRPAATRVAGAMAAVVLEVLQRRRPTSGLARLSEGHCQHLLGAWSRQRDWQGATLGHVHACPVRPRVLEASATLHWQGRVLAVPMRLEHRHGRWVLTHVEVVDPAAVGARMCA